jgi:DNA-binding protein YbaB
MSKGGVGGMDFGGLLKQMQGVQKKMMDAERRLEAAEFIGTAGGGDGDDRFVCTVIGNGKYVVSQIIVGQYFIDKAAAGTFDSSDLILMGDIINAAYNNYAQKVAQGSSDQMADAVSHMGLPADLLGGMGSLLGNNED